MASCRVVLVLSSLLFAIAIACSDGGGSGDSGDGSSDDENDGGGESCSSDTSGMVEIPFAFQGSDCDALGLAVVVDHVFANATLTQFVLSGQFSIDNDNTYYLRGAGLTDGGECYDEIENSGEFAVRTNYLECEEYLEIEVLAKADSESTAFCRFGIRSEIGCDDVDDDDTDDDSVDDDDSQADCEFILNGDVEACFEGITTADVCALEDADCWVSCYQSAETCADWLDCLESDCGYSAADDDSDDDDTVDENSISGTATDFKEGTPLPNATVEAVNDEDGSSFDPAIVGTADENGFVTLSGIPDDAKGAVAIKVTYNGYKDTYQFHFETGTSNETFLAVSNTVVTLVSGLLGITPDPTKGFASGAVYWSDGTDEHPVGCAEVTFDPGVSEVHYFKESALGVLPTDERDTDGNGIGDENGKGTNGVLDGDGGPMSYFVGVNADPGSYTVTANIDGVEATDTIPYLCADCVAITTVVYDSDPNAAWCTE